MNKNEVSTLGIGLGVGLVVGAILGILFAPQSGKETRALVKEKVIEADKVVRGKLGLGTLKDVKPS
jgi:gas vesicle protein